jgi:hypothetical protein
MDRIIETRMCTDRKPQVGNPQSKHNYVKKGYEALLCVDRPMRALMDDVEW